MKTPNLSSWSNLPLDILLSLLERLSFADTNRAKTVCSNWFYASKQTLSRKSETPWLMLIPDGDSDVCVLFNPDEERISRTSRDLSGIRFLANHGNWLLILDSTSNLYMIDLFSENRIDLPPLESLVSSTSSLKRVGDKEFIREYTSGGSSSIMNTDDLRGHMWVNDNAKEFVVVWFFNLPAGWLQFCKNGDDHYTDIPLRLANPHKLLNGLTDLVFSLATKTLKRFVYSKGFHKQMGLVLHLLREWA